MKKTYFQPETEIIDMVIENEILTGSDLIGLDGSGDVESVGFKEDDFVGGDMLSRTIFGQ